MDTAVPRRSLRIFGSGPATREGLPDGTREVDVELRDDAGAVSVVVRDPAPDGRQQRCRTLGELLDAAWECGRAAPMIVLLIVERAS